MTSEIYDTTAAALPSSTLLLAPVLHHQMMSLCTPQKKSGKKQQTRKKWLFLVSLFSDDISWELLRLTSCWKNMKNAKRKLLAGIVSKVSILMSPL
jgi:hypothetical protein